MSTSDVSRLRSREVGIGPRRDGGPSARLLPHLRHRHDAVGHLPAVETLGERDDVPVRMCCTNALNVLKM